MEQSMQHLTEAEETISCDLRQENDVHSARRRVWILSLRKSCNVSSFSPQICGSRNFHIVKILTSRGPCNNSVTMYMCQSLLLLHMCEQILTWNHENCKLPVPLSCPYKTLDGLLKLINAAGLWNDSAQIFRGVVKCLVSSPLTESNSS